MSRAVAVDPLPLRSPPLAVRRVLPFLWMVAWLFSLQLGPVYTLRLRAAPLVVDFVDDGFVALWFASLAAAGWAVRPLRRHPFPLGRAAYAFVAWWSLLALSLVWSVNRARTFTQVVLLAATGLSALVAVQVGTRRSFAAALALSNQIGALIAYRSVRAHWIGAIDEYGQWTGIYFNRNSLGPVASVAVLGVFWLTGPFVRWARGRPARMLWLGAGLVGGVALVAVDVRLAIGAGSVTPVVAAAATVAATVAVRALRRLIAGPDALVRRMRFAVVAFGVSAFAGGALLRTALPRLFGKSDDFNHRGDIWRSVLDGIRVHPIRGWGWMAAWTDPSFMQGVVARLGQPVGSAHNGVLEVVLGTGVVGGVVVIGALIGAFGATLRDALSPGEPLADLPFGLVVYVLVVNLMESFLGADVLPTAMLFVAVLLVARRTSELACPPDQSGQRTRTVDSTID